MNLNGHFESRGWLAARSDEVFAQLDDHYRLSAHMSRSSWMMGGARMSIETDELRGQSVGSRIRLAGRVLGMRLFLEEAVTERNPPRRKVWQTVGTPRLLIIGDYRMGFEIAPEGEGSRLRVFIDYALPQTPPARWLGRLLAPSYARWCTESMVNDAIEHFSPAEGQAAQAR